VSPDGIEDLAGNADEWASDNYESYGGPCWDTPIRTDPTCDDPDSSENVTRGGNALSLEQSLLSAMRTFHVPGTAGPTRGFRCAYGATSP
jgi:formylglycine-generating enzyme required for sulfatase activity